MVTLQSGVCPAIAASVEVDPARISSLEIESMLRDLPSAHPAPLIGRVRSAPLRPALAGPATPATPAEPHWRIRFVYFPVTGGNKAREAYHQHLVNAEVLLERVLGAVAAGLHPICPSLTRAVEARATRRPPRQLLHPGALEYRRWYDRHDQARLQPLTLDALADWLAHVEGVPLERARQCVQRRTRALAGVEQLRLLQRQAAPKDRRPLDQTEFKRLVEALDGAWRVPAGMPQLERANREIARRAVALLASLQDKFISSPFVAADLDHTFSSTLVDTLRRHIESSRQAETLCVGPRAWFAAKTVRMQVEHQVGMALTPSVTDARDRFRAAALRVRMAANRHSFRDAVAG